MAAIGKGDEAVVAALLVFAKVLFASVGVNCMLLEYDVKYIVLGLEHVSLLCRLGR